MLLGWKGEGSHSRTGDSTSPPSPHTPLPPMKNVATSSLFGWLVGERRNLIVNDVECCSGVRVILQSVLFYIRYIKRRKKKEETPLFQGCFERARRAQCGEFGKEGGQEYQAELCVVKGNPPMQVTTRSPYARNPQDGFSLSLPTP